MEQTAGQTEEKWKMKKNASETRRQDAETNRQTRDASVTRNGTGDRASERARTQSRAPYLGPTLNGDAGGRRFGG